MTKSKSVALAGVASSSAFVLRASFVIRHSSFVIPILFLFAAIFFVPASLAQQSRDPRLGYVYPAGGQRGTTVEVTIGGRLLDGTKEALVSGSGVKATIVGVRKPIPQKRLNELRDYLGEARKKIAEAKTLPMFKTDRVEWITSTLKEAGASEEEIQQFFQMRKERSDPKRQQNLQLADRATVKLEIAADAPAGPRDLRLLTPAGISNPLVFCVSGLPEQSESEPEDGAAKEVPRVKLPAILNGQILPGEIDRFDFDAARGTRIVVAVHARDLIPYLADAVPGWFQPVVALYDPKHKEVAYADDFRFGPDPVLAYDVREAGVHRLEIRDALYRGREDFVYRIAAGTIPFVTGIFPLGGHVGTPATVDVSGWNLNFSRMKFPAQNEEGIHPVNSLSNGFAIGDVAYAEDAFRESTEREPNSDQARAQKVELPIIVNGRIDAPGDTDVFSFTCKPGEEIVAEVTARRVNSPVDSWLKITDSAGKQLAFNDDNEDKGSGLLTHHADSRLSFTASAEGTYFARIGDSQHKGGPEYAYRLRISAPRPDFALRIVPSAINARTGALVPVTIYALRKDGFSGDIALALKDAPPGFLLEGACIPAGTDKIRATLACPLVATERPLSLVVEGHARIGETDITRKAVPADDLLQAFFYHHLVPAKELLVTVVGPKSGKVPIHVVGDAPMKLPVGGVGKTVLSSKGRPPFNLAEAQAQLVDPPEGISVEGLSAAEGGAALSFRADSSTVKPGTKGNLIVELFGEKTPPPKEGQKPVKNRWSMGYLPAIPFEVVGR